MLKGFDQLFLSMFKRIGLIIMIARPTVSGMNEATIINRLYGATARRIRKRQRLTLAEVVASAREAGHTLDISTLSLLERGLMSWSTDRFVAVASGLGAPLWFFGGAPTGAVAAAA